MNGLIRYTRPADLFDWNRTLDSFFDDTPVWNTQTPAVRRFDGERNCHAHRVFRVKGFWLFVNYKPSAMLFVTGIIFVVTMCQVWRFGHHAYVYNHNL